MTGPELQNKSKLILTLSELSVIDEVMGDVANSKYSIGSNILKRRFNKNRAAFIRDETKAVIDTAKQTASQNNAELMSVRAGFVASESTREFIGQALGLTLHDLGNNVLINGSLEDRAARTEKINEMKVLALVINR